MKILAIGDVIGKIGCTFLREKLPQLKKIRQIDVVIANGENSSDGNGITPASAEYLFTSGVDVITTGNHAFRRKESYDLYDNCEYLIRPANFPNGTTPGKGMTILDMGKIQVAVINLMGTAYLEPLDCPFKEADLLIAQAKEANAKIIIVDFHAEATGEKRAMGYYLDGRVSAMFGTHTHVQTADATILPQGSGYITDVGMTGPIDSVLGVKPEIIIKKFTEKLPQRFEIATGDCKLNCVLMEIDDKTGKTVNIEAIEIL
ncbi:MAG: TIGR00282 family metallophosphoesterase [Acutalibacteraceae bacterium]|nr:TIGR00282 family metallophosphoesterase [Acutalibacteraceae bacterium]